ncbi:MAG: hypothetical protein JRJ38_19420 [Deltaproteobacteria bacterium]|nr:hypothetical protein [Deltaproteobacteria bacterium]
MPDIEMALRKILFEYLDLKLKELQGQAKEFEEKWSMSFEEFSAKCKEKEIGEDVYSYEVEKDFWDWEKIETLRKHYGEVKSQWM